MRGVDDSEAAAATKQFSHLAARAALAGFQLWRSDADDGPQRFFAGRWGLIHVMADADEVDAWLTRVTGKAAA